jgi:hypothetical protein
MAKGPIPSRAAPPVDIQLALFRCCTVNDCHEKPWLLSRLPDAEIVSDGALRKR